MFLWGVFGKIAGDCFEVDFLTRFLGGGVCVDLRQVVETDFVGFCLGIGCFVKLMLNWFCFLGGFNDISLGLYCIFVPEWASKKN